MYLGQAMNSFANGVQQGYGFVDNAIGKKQDREIQQQQAKQQADLRAEQIKQAQMNSGWMQELDDANPNAQMQKLQQEQTRLQKEITRRDGNMIKSEVLTPYTLASNTAERDELLPTMKMKLKNNTSAMASLGVKNVDTIEVLRASNPADRGYMADLLSRSGTTAQSLGFDLDTDEGKDNWDNYLGGIVEIYPAVKAEGKYIDMDSLSRATGAYNTMSPEEKKKSETNFKSLQSAMEVSMPEESVQKGEATKDAGALDRYKAKEGFRAEVYTDTTGNKTIGYGHKIKPDEKHLLGASLSEEDATALLAKDVAEHDEALLANEPWVAELPEDKQKAIKDMAFNMGPDFLDKKFPSVKKALQDGDYQKAGDIIKGSKYARQVGARADENVTLLTGGASQDPKQAMQDVAKEVQATGKPISQERMDYLYAVTGVPNPNKAGKRTTSSKMKDTQFLIESGVSKDEAINTIYGAKDKASSITKGAQSALVGSEKLAELNAKEANGETLSAKEQRDKAIYTEMAGDYGNTAHQQNMEADLKMSGEGRVQSDEALKILGGADIDDKTRSEGMRKLENAQGKLRNGDPKTHQTEKETIQTMKDTQVSINSLANTMNRIESGDLKDIDKGIVAN
ncbi:MAG: hypothetical protein DRH24_19900, partial [Deltaproteobacteria bacterium]